MRSPSSGMSNLLTIRCRRGSGVGAADGVALGGQQRIEKTVFINLPPEQPSAPRTAFKFQQRRTESRGSVQQVLSTMLPHGG